MKVKHKSALSFLLALVMILSLFAGPAFPAKAAGTDDAWQQITQGMLNWQEEIDITACAVTKNEFLSSIWPQVVTRNPDLFYVWDITYYTDSATDIVTTIKVIYNTKYNRDSVREYEAALDRAYNEVIRTDMSDVQKALALHDYLVQHMEYDQAGVTAGTEKRNAYEALVNGIGVCEGYTLAYAALLEKAGIESDYCESRAMNHIWNYVKLNNNWYHVDVTQDDVSKDRKGIVSHRYFLNSTTQLLADGNHHSLDTTTACTDTSYDTMYWQEEDISAVFPVANKEYFIRARKNDQNLYLGGIDLVERTGSSEKIITHYDTQWILGSTMWINTPMISLSYYGGVLYFHDAGNLYAFNPETDAEPSVIYTYDGNDGVIGSSFVCNDKAVLTIDQPVNQVKQITVPLGGDTGKAEQKLAFADASLVRYPGDVPFTNPLERTADGGAVTYSSSNPAVASIDENGKVTINGAGQAVITASAAETADYLPASTSYTITVKENPAAVSPDADLNGKVLVSKEVSAEQQSALEEAANGSFHAQLEGKSLIYLDVQLIESATGQPVYDEEVTFTISYPEEITPENYGSYDFTVLHLNQDGSVKAIVPLATENGLSVTSASGPFIIGYGLKPSEPEHTHVYGTAWNFDANNHWYECVCGERTGVAAHTFRWIIDKEATSAEAGSKHEKCTVCGYRNAAVTIPATGSPEQETGSGSGQPDSGQPDSGTSTAPATADDSRPVFWLFLFALAGTVSAGITLYRRKRAFWR